MCYSAEKSIFFTFFYFFLVFTPHLLVFCIKKYYDNSNNV